MCFGDTNKACLGEEELKRILLEDRYTIITAEIFANALLEYCRLKHLDKYNASKKS